MVRASDDLRPALLASVALHLLAVAAGIITWPSLSRRIPTATVPVKLVAQAPVNDVRPAVEAPEPAPAAAPEEVVEPPPEPTPPAAVAPPKPPPPTPVPPKPAPPAPPKPQPLDLDALATKLPKSQPKLNLDALASRMPAKPQPRLDLNALAASAPKTANRGQVRPETAPQARPSLGAAQGLTADEASLLAAKLNRLWNPNCGAEGAARVQVRVNIRLTQTGALASPPTLIGGSGDPVWQAAAQRALTAVARGAPYDELPRDRYAVWKDINFNFNGREACGG